MPRFGRLFSSNLMGSPPQRVACFLILAFATSFTTFQPAKLPAQTQNSTRKLRVKPTTAAMRIGSAIEWNKDFQVALEESKNENKPILWYVPTLPNTFMDRKQEIDRYMLAGPFSWPAIIELVNDSTIPLRMAPNPKLQKQYGINPYEFVEPGILLIDGQGAKQYSVDRLTTIHPAWLLGLLEQRLRVSQPRSIYSSGLVPAWEAFARRDYATAAKLTAEVQQNTEKQSTEAVEAGLLQGMVEFRNGRHSQADKIWKQVSTQNPDHPLAWKAAAEVQRIGPFSRGFEVHVRLPDLAMQAGVKSVGSAAPENCYTESQLWNRSTHYLLGMQHQNGGFYDSDYDFGGTDSLPNVYVAVSSLAGMALIKSYDRELASGGIADRKTIKEAIHRALKFCLDEKNINSVDRDEILWAYAYRLRLLARCKSHPDMQFADVEFDAALAKCIQSLQSVQSRRGNWYHEYGNPFVTGTALLALHEAQQAGGTVSQDVIETGVASLAKDRYQNGAYPYGNSRGDAKKAGSERDLAAAAGRMPLCELALLRFGKSKQNELEKAIQLSLNLHENLNSALKYDNHTSNLAYGGFFFWYDMRSRSEAILAVQDKARRTTFRNAHKKLILALPELDGCFIDSHELGRVYGTSMALMSLANVNQD